MIGLCKIEHSDRWLDRVGCKYDTDALVDRGHDYRKFQRFVCNSERHFKKRLVSRTHYIYQIVAGHKPICTVRLRQKHDGIAKLITLPRIVDRNHRISRIRNKIHANSILVCHTKVFLEKRLFKAVFDDIPVPLVYKFLIKLICQGCRHQAQKYGQGEHERKQLAEMLCFHVRTAPSR